MNRAFNWFFGSTLTLCSITSAAELDDLRSKLKSPDVVAAFRSYDEASKKAHFALQLSLSDAQKQLLSKLEAAQNRATQSDNLDEAVMIRDCRNAITKSSAKAEEQRHFKVISAAYGANVSWIDVTSIVQKLPLEKGQLKLRATNELLGDFHPGYGGPASLLVRYELNGKVHLRACYRGEELTIPLK